MMKKIFALLVATVMLLAFSNIAFAADDYSMSVEYWDVDEENLIEDLSELEVGDQFYCYVYFSEIPENFTAFSTIISMDKSVIDMVEEDGALACFSNNKVSSRDYWAATAKVNAEGNYTFSYAGDAVNKAGKYAFDTEAPLYQFLCEVKGEGTTALATDVTGFADEAGKEYFPTTEIAEEITIGSGVVGPTVIVPTAATLTDVVESTEKAGWQKGQAVAMSFNVADLASFAGMNWKINLATAGAKYAPVAFDAATIAAIGTPEVQFVASFVVNTEADVDGDVINSVEAGFCDADKALVAKTTPVAITALN